MEVILVTRERLTWWQALRYRLQSMVVDDRKGTIMFAAAIPFILAIAAYGWYLILAR